MGETRTCPKCGRELPANAPSGICPQCLMGAGLDGVDESAAASSGFAVTRPQTGGLLPPDPATVAPHFPHLEISELIGHGGMGAVYKARQIKLDRLVALKIMRPESAEDAAFAERFNREARTLARLDHPHIVAVHDFGEVTLADPDSKSGSPGTLYCFLMEYVRSYCGRSPANRIDAISMPVSSRRTSSRSPGAVPSGTMPHRNPRPRQRARRHRRRDSSKPPRRSAVPGRPCLSWDLSTAWQVIDTLGPPDLRQELPLTEGVKQLDHLPAADGTSDSQSAGQPAEYEELVWRSNRIFKNAQQHIAVLLRDGKVMARRQNGVE